MASSFVVGDKFREKVKELFEKDSSVPADLLEQLEPILEGEGESRIPFSAVRKLNAYLQSNGKEQTVLYDRC